MWAVIGRLTMTSKHCILKFPLGCLFGNAVVTIYNMLQSHGQVGENAV